MTDRIQNCGHNNCGACCGGTLELTQKEIALLYRFAQIPFLPVARRADSMAPIYLENGTEDYGAVIAVLEHKQLIDLDYGLPLSNFDYAGYEQYPCKGSMALTARGQTVVELLEIQGIEA